MAGNTLGDLLKAGQLDMLKQASSDNKASEKKPAKTNVAKPKEKSLSSTNTSKDTLQEDYRIFHSYVRSVVQKNELYDTMFDYGDEDSFAVLSELYDSQVCKDIIDYFACCFYEGEYDFLDTVAKDCEKGYDESPNSHATILGHKVPITFEEEYELLSLLCSTAIKLDGHFDEEPQEETVIVYTGPTVTTEKVHVSPHTKEREQKRQPAISQRELSKPNKLNRPQSTKKHSEPQKIQPKRVSRTPQDMRTLAVKVCFSRNYKWLGVTTIIVELFEQGKYSEIINFFKTSFQTYYKRQKMFGESTFRDMWDSAQEYITNFISGNKTYSGRIISAYKRRRFSSYMANSGVWGRMASFGGTNGRIIRINAGHGRR